MVWVLDMMPMVQMFHSIVRLPIFLTRIPYETIVLFPNDFCGTFDEHRS